MGAAAGTHDATPRRLPGTGRVNFADVKRRRMPQTRAALPAQAVDRIAIDRSAGKGGPFDERVGSASWPVTVS